MLKYTLIAILLCALALCASCDAAKSSASLDGGRQAFSVVLDQQASIGAGTAQLSLEAVAAAGALEYTVCATQLSGAKALIGSVAYDAQQYHLAGGLPAELTADDALLLCVDRPAEGRVYFGWVLANYDTRPGLSGDLALCNLRFASGAAEVDKVTAKAPGGGDNHFTIEGSIDPDTNIPTLTWLEANAGDGDDNGEVNISDITPLGASFGKTPGAGPADSQARDADYDKNGEVNISDMTPLGRNLGTILTGYAILSGPTAGSLTEQVRFARTAMFPGTLNAASGELTWIWTGPAITADTTFQVQPYDAAGALGQASDNTVTLTYNNPIPVITGIESVTFDEAPTWFNNVGTDYTILLTELSVDNIDGNAESMPGVVEQLQLKGMVTTDQDPQPIDGSESLIWYISEGAGLASVSNTAGSKGLLTFHWQDGQGNDVHGDRGRVVIEAQIPGNFNNKKSIAFVLMSIDTLELQLAAGGSGPLAVNAGATVPLKAVGTFDFDNVLNGNEYTTDLTGFVNWAALVEPVGTSYSINTNAGILDTAGAASGAQIRVTCEFPRTDNVTLFDNEKRVSNFLEVNIN